jgi:squalene-hopene/tetraprenyl-beta-curcumene cyclase
MFARLSKRLLISATLFVSLAHAAPPSAETTVRDAAQKGTDYLAKSTAAWQRANRCYGCHVQAVTLEGLSVAKSHQYKVPGQEFAELLDGILRLPGGARAPGPITHSSYPRTALTFGSAALARYDALVDAKLTDDLLVHAKALMKLQDENGAVRGDHESAPVTMGVMQSTFQAAQTWRQAHARTADDIWLAPLRKAEGFIVKTVAGWNGNPKGVEAQVVNYALLGVLASGASRADASVRQLVTFVLERQQKDGGFGNALLTGQTVYALRQAGLTEKDSAVERGLSWLVRHQQQDGGWGAGGAGKAEAMWAVLGLVSTDVLSVAVKGIQDGAHVDAVHELTVDAEDNQKGTVAKVELFVDDVLVKTVKAKTLKHTLKTEGLKDGLHTLDVVATNAKGQVSRRRLQVYAGNVFFLGLGTRFTDEGTQVAVRGIAAPDKGQLELKVFKVEMKNGAPVPGAQVQTSKLTAALGPLAFMFNSKDKSGQAMPTGRYFAEVAYLDAKGAALQKESTLFTHDTPEAQKQRFAEVAGKLELKRDGMIAANAEVELVDDSGNVVQRTVSNEAGQYRFKSVDQGKYKVRFRKDGFERNEVEVKAAAGMVAPADSKL